MAIGFLRSSNRYAHSENNYNLGRQYTRFTATVGVDDEVGPNGAVVFQVFADGVKIYDSEAIIGGAFELSMTVRLVGFEAVQIKGMLANEENLVKSSGFHVDSLDYINGVLAAPRGLRHGENRSTERNA
ncbi:NPCBM/NEW2 domain-containing protein [Paenibacillus sp. KN14-4R]|uniref:NPCBM/NEW2 domain-containing protein n=1 Tax=Paenibacillus sp. KN14-4R TaxID=3445773 RepID=UPI003FA11676